MSSKALVIAHVRRPPSHIVYSIRPKDYRRDKKTQNFIE